MSKPSTVSNVFLFSFFFFLRTQQSFSLNVLNELSGLLTLNLQLVS